jgi:hypothetical protein
MQRMISSLGFIGRMLLRARRAKEFPAAESTRQGLYLAGAFWFKEFHSMARYFGMSMTAALTTERPGRIRA